MTSICIRESRVFLSFGAHLEKAMVRDTTIAGKFLVISGEHLDVNARLTMMRTMAEEA